MPEQRGVKPYDKRLDKSLTTVADIESMKDQVQMWTHMVQKHVDDALALATQNYTKIHADAIAAAQQALHDEINTLRGIVEEYRSDDLRYRQERTWRGRLRRLVGLPASSSPLVPGGPVAR